MALIDTVKILLQTYEKGKVDALVHQQTVDLLHNTFGSDAASVLRDAVELDEEGNASLRAGRTYNLVWREILLELCNGTFDEQTDNGGQIVLYTDVMEDDDENIVEFVEEEDED